MPGSSAPDVLQAILALLPLDDFVAQSAWTMQVVGDPAARPPVVAEFDAVLRAHGCRSAAALERFDFNQLHAAQDLGARPDQAFRRILLPQIRSGIITACIFMFIPILGEFLTPTLVGGVQGSLIANLVVNFFRQFEEVPQLSISELMKQEKQVQDELREEIKRLECQIEIEQVAQRELRQRYANIKIH